MELESDSGIGIVHSSGELKCAVEHFAVVKLWTSTWRTTWVLVCVRVCACVRACVCVCACMCVHVQVFVCL